MCEYSFKQQYLFLLKGFKSGDTGHSDTVPATNLGSCLLLTRKQLLSDIEMLLKTQKEGCTVYILFFEPFSCLWLNLFLKNYILFGTILSACQA